MNPLKKRKNLLIAYKAILGYHNGLVYMRFTIAGLFLTASAVILGTLYSAPRCLDPFATIPFIGLILSLIAWLLEIRTRHLLDNLYCQGRCIEDKLQIDTEARFFSLMEKQLLEQPKMPFFPVCLGQNKFVRYVVSHTFALHLLYAGFLLFWLYSLWSWQVVLIVVLLYLFIGFIGWVMTSDCPTSKST